MGLRMKTMENLHERSICDRNIEILIHEDMMMWCTSLCPHDLIDERKVKKHKAGESGRGDPNL